MQSQQENQSNDDLAPITNADPASSPRHQPPSWSNFAPAHSTYALSPEKECENSYRRMEDGQRKGDPCYGDDDDAQTYAPSIATTVLTAAGIADPLGFFIVCFVVLVGDMSRGVVFPTLWPLVESLGGTEVTLGYAVGAFSFGRVLVSPRFGAMSVSRGYKPTLLLSCSILLIGTLLYAQVPTVGSTTFLLFAQAVLGVGSGTLGVTRAYVAEVTPTRDRTTYLAWLSAVEYLGFAGTPCVGSAFLRYFDEDNGRTVEQGFFSLNAYTAPGYFMAVLVSITLALLLTVFRDRQRSKPAAKGGTGGSSQKSAPALSRRRAALDELANAPTRCCGLATIQACMVGCMLLNVATKGSISSFETLGITLADSHFGLPAATAGNIVAFCGFAGVAALLLMGRIARFLTDIQMIAGGMAVMMAGIAFLGSPGLSDDGNSPAWIYATAIFLIYSVGYSVGHAAVIGLFSKLVGRQPQGTLLGWFSVAGSLARMCFPLMSGYVVHYRDVTTLCVVLVGVLGAGIAFVMVNRVTLARLSV